MTRQYTLSESSPSPQKNTDNWILQRTAVRSCQRHGAARSQPAKTLTPQRETPAGDLLAAAPMRDHAKGMALRDRSPIKLDLMQIPVAQREGDISDRETALQQQEKEKKGENKTGLPDQLKAGIESVSGYDLSGVRVNYNSSKPAQLNAHAYTQGNAIEVAPGQEQHLPHEAWHVVQQMQGRVRETMEVNGVGVNGDQGLEREADVMGKKAIQRKSTKGNGSEGGGDPNPQRQRGKVEKTFPMIVQRRAADYGTLKNEQGTSANVLIEGKNDPEINKGSAPSVDAKWFGGLNADTKNWFRKTFVRGHLLNEKLGGTGKSMENLAYITYSTNTTHLKAIEKKVKQLVEADNKVLYEVWADYTTEPFDVKKLPKPPSSKIEADLLAKWKLPPGAFKAQYKVTDGPAKKTKDKQSKLVWIKNEGSDQKGEWK